MRSSHTWFSIALLSWGAAFVNPALGSASPISPNSRSSETLESDVRLEQPVDLQRPRAYLGELVEDLEKQCHIPLSIDSNKGEVDGLPIALYVKRVPLRSVLNGIVEALSSQFDQWEWQPSGNGYILRHQRTPSAAAEAARRSMFQRWLVSLQNCVEMSRLPDDARELATKAHPDLFAPGHAEHGKLDVLSFLGPGELDTLAKGGFVPVDPARLSRRAVAQLEKNLNLNGQPQRKTPGLFVAWGPKSTGPTLWLRDRDGGAENVIGGLLWDSAWYRNENHGWKYRGDEEVERLYRPIRMADPSVGKPISAASVAEWLGIEWRAHGTNIIALLDYPQAKVQLTRAWLGPDARTTMCALVIDQEMVWRTVGTLHLLRYSEVLTHPRRYLVSWPLIRDLREASEHNDGYLGLKELGKLSEFAPEQRASLAEEFPDADSKQLSNWTPILQLLRTMIPERQEALLRPPGVRLADIGLLSRNVLLEGDDPQNIRGLAILNNHPRDATISLRCEETLSARGARQKNLIWEVRAAGEVDHRRTITLSRRRPLKPSSVRDIPLEPMAPRALPLPG